MKLYTLDREQFIGRPINQVYEFFNSPENLEEITPKNLGFKILTPRPIQMRQGAAIDYTLKILGIPVRWTSLIVDCAPPYKFVDTQIRGPYAFWHHTHTFQEKGNGTLMRDSIRYAIPLGPIGQLAHYLFVKRNLNALFDFRKAYIGKAFSEEIKSRRGS